MFFNLFNDPLRVFESDGLSFNTFAHNNHHLKLSFAE